MSDSAEFVILRNGLALPIEALRLAWSLESRGLELEIDGDALTVGPRDRLTQTDRDAIRRWRNHLMAMVGCPDEAIV